MKVFLAFPVLLFLLFSTPALADFAKGLDASMRGDYAIAIQIVKLTVPSNLKLDFLNTLISNPMTSF